MAVQAGINATISIWSSSTQLATTSQPPNTAYSTAHAHPIWSSSTQLATTYQPPNTAYSTAHAHHTVSINCMYLYKSNCNTEGVEQNIVLMFIFKMVSLKSQFSVSLSGKGCLLIHSIWEDCRLLRVDSIA